MRVVERRFDELSSLRYQVYSAELKSGLDVLIVAFSGNYRQGAGGDGDATFMRANTRAALSAWPSFGLVLDFRELEYKFGDMMASVLSCAEDQWVDAEFPVRIIVSDRCREGIQSLVEDELFQVASQWVSESVEQALSSILASLKSSAAQGLVPGWDPD